MGFVYLLNVTLEYIAIVVGTLFVLFWYNATQTSNGGMTTCMFAVLASIYIVLPCSVVMTIIFCCYCCRMEGTAIEECGEDDEENDLDDEDDDEDYENEDESESECVKNEKDNKKDDTI